MKFTRSETADYLAAQSAELKKLAKSAGLESLSYIFAMAELEAHNLIEARSLTKAA